MREASDGSSALEAVAEERFSHVFLEVHLPGLGGIEMARLIRDRDPRAVTILMSADQQDVLRVRQAGLGPSMTLVKPLSPSHVHGGAPPRARVGTSQPGSGRVRPSCRARGLTCPRRVRRDSISGRHVRVDPVDDTIGRHRAGDAEPLDLLDPDRAQPGPGFQVFDALGDGGQPELPGQPGERAAR